MYVNGCDGEALGGRDHVLFAGVVIGSVAVVGLGNDVGVNGPFALWLSDVEFQASFMLNDRGIPLRNV